ncbi:MAG: cell division protein ZapA [Oceanicola sp.]|nr:cell division protein ZapA [Oceanicola sp.]
MPEVTIAIGGREFVVACQEGEEEYLKTAANMLNEEASGLITQIGRMPESRMLLMAGLMLADRTAAFEEQAKVAEAKVAEQQAVIEELRNAPKPEPERKEVPVVPAELLETMSEMAARAEALASFAEEKAAEEAS